MFDKFSKHFGTAIFILSVCLRVTSFRPVYENTLKNLTDDSSRNATSLSRKSMTLRGTRNDLERYTESRRDPRRVDSIESPLNYLIDNENKEVENCSSHSINDFPTDLFTPEQRKRGAALLHAFFGFYCFLITAYACNDYLLPALDLICADINISPNVAGATFLATASCFPELFVSVVGTFLTESDLGIGTVVGGAVFNTFATPAFGALSAAQGIQLEWTVLSRDCIIYIISVLVLVLVMWDGLVTWYEAMSLIIMFAAYFTLLFLNDTLSRCVHRIKARWRRNSGLSPDREGCNPEHEIMPVGSFKPFVHGELVTEYRNSLKITKKLKTIESLNGQLSVVEELEEYIEPECALAMRPSGTIFNKVWFLLTWPIKICLFLTIPDSRYKKLRNWYPLSFIMCIMWIAVSSYLVSWMMTVVGDTLGIADSIMGITFLSAGGNMPELVSIVILSRKGNGDMAMSNTLGANTLDVLLCLGLPWTIRTLMTGKNVEIESGALAYSVLSIIICVVGFFAVTAYYKFTLNKKVGVACLLMYALFLTVSILMESNVFFPVNLPMCKS